jgi:hypothetical protein
MLLHTCCAPCALPIIDGSTLLTINPERRRRIEYLSKEKRIKDIVLYFYNPNIYPEKEYQTRLEEVKKISKIYNLKLIIGEYEHNKWLTYLRKALSHPLDSYPENSERCLNCFCFRLEKTAAFAKENNFNSFTTTLSVNRFKDTKFINNYGQRLAKKYALDYLILDIDPYQAHKKEQELVKKYNLYSQKYCGCEFSMV